jgi:AcrR family transcriptional regulator
MSSAKSSPEATRAALLDSARDLFLKNSYENISIRKIADKAKVNSAMIAYYFGSKNGLFREMITSYISTVTKQLKSNIHMAPKASTLEDILFNFYRNMPTELAMLVFRTLYFEQNDMRAWILDSLLKPTFSIAEEYLENMIEGSKRQEVTLIVRVSFQSLLVGPKLLEKPLKELSPDAFDEDFYRELAHFNAKLFASYFNLDS